MKHATYHYKTKVTFSNAVHDHSFLLRCVPQSNDFQQIVSETCLVQPHASLSKGADSFGNIVYSGHIKDLHNFFEFETYGKILLSDNYAIQEPLNRIYLYPSAYTFPDEMVCNLLNSIALQADDSIMEKVLKLSDALYSRLEYSPNTTNINTTAAEVLQMGRGVCQDFAHVFIALCRHAGIAARYAAGFMEGEGYTHAWVEFYDNGAWRAIDPTHNRLVQTGYIKLSHGRDFEDCSIERGVFSGITEQRLSVELMVEMNV